MILIRFLYWVAVITLGGFSLWFSWSKPPTATQHLDVNHKIQPGDLQTPEIIDLTNHYLRHAVNPGDAVSPDMVGEQAIVPVMQSGLVAVVRMSNAMRKQRGIDVKDNVQIEAGALEVAGVVSAVVCDETNCGIAVALDAASGLDTKALQGAELKKLQPSNTSKSGQ